MKKTMMIVTVLMLAGAAMADTHAPWPTDWNNWNDPALWATVGNPGNASDTRYSTPGYGAVAYTYRIGKFEVTASQYCQFLNAVAATDTYGLYNTNMADLSVGQNGKGYGDNIQRTGSPGSYRYSVASDWENRPANWISWGNAARFANWLSNGQPSGVQNLSTTEDGSYYLNGANTDAQLLAVTRKANAKYVIPTEDEWYKAAYYDLNRPGGAGYWDYPTRSNANPANILSSTGANNDNYRDFYGTGNGDYCIGGPYYRTEVGAFPCSPGSYGTFDQGGNVLELNEAISGTYRGVRGGSFYGSPYTQLAANNYGGDPTFANIDWGFRIAEIPEPASLSLVAISLVLLRKRRK